MFLPSSSALSPFPLVLRPCLSPSWITQEGKAVLIDSHWSFPRPEQKVNDEPLLSPSQREVTRRVPLRFTALFWSGDPTSSLPALFSPPYFALRSAVYPFQPKAGVWSACPAFQPCGWWSGLLNVTPDITHPCRGGFQPYSELTHARGVNIHAKNLSAHVCLRTAPSVLKKFGWRNILVLNWQETVRKINAIINERWLWN